MPLYAAMGFDHPRHSAALRDEHRPQHRAYVRANDHAIRLAGALYNEKGEQCGTLMIFEAESEEEIWAWYRKEPFFKENVYDRFHVTEWHLAFNSLAQQTWMDNYPASLK